MKKIVLLFALLGMPLAVIAAPDAGTAPEQAEAVEKSDAEKTAESNRRKGYVGIYLMYPQYEIAFAGLQNAEREIDTWGLGFLYGARPTKEIAIDIEASGFRINVSTLQQSTYLENFTLAIGGTYGREWFGFLRPYIGAGIGLSVWTNDTLWFSNGSRNEKTEDKLNFSYLVKLGVIFDMFESMDFDVHLKFQNLGNIPHVGAPDFNAVGNTAIAELRIGVMYKF